MRAVEVLQVLMAFAGVVMTLRAKVNADRNALAVHLSGLNGQLRIIASKNKRIENVLLFVQVVFLLAGCVTLLYGTPDLERNYMREANARTGAMFWSSAVLCWLSYRNWLELLPMSRRKEDLPAPPPELTEPIEDEDRLP